MTARRATAVAPAPVASVLALERRGRYLRGLRLVDSLLADGRAAELLAAKARLLAARGRYVDALEVADLAVDLWPSSPVAHASRADVLADRDRYHEAVEAADQALALDHSHAMALRVKALALSELGQVSEGRQLASRAIAADPDDLDSHLVLAQVLTKVSAFEARRHADKLVRESRDATSLAGRALILLLIDDLDGAATTAEEAVALDPENEAAGLAAMVIDLTAGRWDETIVRAENPPLRGSLHAAFASSIAYRQIGRADETRSAVLELVEQQPEQPEALRLLRDLQLDRGEWAALTLTSGRLLAFDSDDVDTRRIRARALCETDRPAAALTDLDAVLAARPGDWTALAIRSMAYVMLEQPARALVDADAALAAGATATSLATTGRMIALLALNRRGEAEEMARRVLRADPGDSLARNILEAAQARRQAQIEDVVSLAKFALRLFTG